ncbi:MAG: hypothetical protein KDB06_05805 [Ilumatobacter sp.]|nr:hypothetical protein [Ilumatobacter sp.]
MSHPVGLPELFLDRSLGGKKVPSLLREAGLRLETLAEHYGVPADEDVTDEEWLEYAGKAGKVVFMKDARIRRNEAERAVVVEHKVRCFCIANQAINAEEIAARYLANLPAIIEACAQPGPCIYTVHEKRIERLL